MKVLQNIDSKEKFMQCVLKREKKKKKIVNDYRGSSLLPMVSKVILIKDGSIFCITNVSKMVDKKCP